MPAEKRVNATLAALKEKFGEPSQSLAAGTVLSWSFLAGRPLTEADGSSFQACNAGSNGVTEIGNIYQTGQRKNEEDISRPIMDVLRTLRSKEGRCDINVVATYQIPGEYVNGRYLENPNVVRQLIVYMLDYTRLQATIAQDAAALNAEIERDRQAQPSGGAPPKL